MTEEKHANLDGLEEEMAFLATKTLGVLKGRFSEHNFDDREATLSLFFFIELFCKFGWKGEKPSDVLKNAIEVMQTAGGDVPFVEEDLR